MTTTSNTDTETKDNTMTEAADADQFETVSDRIDPDASPAEVASPEPESSEGNEAAKYRRRLRETEAQRDSLAEQLSTAQGELAASVLAGVLDHPESFWLTGANPSDYFNDGTLDRERLRQDARAAAAANGLAAAQVTTIFSPTLGREGQLDPAGPAWLAAFGPRA